MHAPLKQGTLSSIFIGLPLSGLMYQNEWTHGFIQSKMFDEKKKRSEEYCKSERKNNTDKFLNQCFSYHDFKTVAYHPKGIS